ncbi:MAG TPA: D-alanyl-D-alanine carboxypeptidase/D-alanyl-D-alanine-endopeptidase [Gemmatimonadota bacterium]|nr:D-alanyl-D-alanine carboxypeptidase/D-alanyl-D-alanine-endopeptidase [Gemmatimonadota bacterium]
MNRVCMLMLALVLAGAVPVEAQTPQGTSPDELYAPSASPAAIASTLDPVLRARRGSIGVAVYSVDRSAPLYLRDADRALLPASNMKLYTTAAALDRLGPDFQYTTSVYADGPLLPGGVLDGNLILVGRGDPSLSGRFFADSAPYVLDKFADELRRAGVRRVTGRLIGDASFFDDELAARGWEVGNLLWWYGARVSALSFNDNVVTVEIRPGPAVGAPAEISFYPRSDGLRVANRAVTSGPRGGRSIGIGRRPDIGGYDIWGRIPVGGTPVRYVVAVEDPAVFTLSVMRDRLQRFGIEVTGRDQVVYDRDLLPRRARRLVASHTSPRLIEFVRVVNKRSQNFFAEQILKTLGAVVEGDGSFDDGADVVHDLLRGFGVSTRSVVIDDGSGLSRRDVVTARTTAELLVVMRSHPLFDEYYDSLLIAGLDGDPRRLDAPAALGNVRTKTGTLRGVSALSGYATTRDGELLAFSVITNGMPGGKGASIGLEDAVAEALAAHTWRTSPTLEREVGR